MYVICHYSYSGSLRLAARYICSASFCRLKEKWIATVLAIGPAANFRNSDFRLCKMHFTSLLVEQSQATHGKPSAFTLPTVCIAGLGRVFR
jgi:hypothetical protein